ncbi:MAG TPA: hypothetical protein VF525_13415 [Pyrinomonadaceae bacterium]
MNIENASFCRACGTNLSLVPQALTGHLPEALTEVEGRRAARRRRKRDEPPSVEKAIKEVFSGLAFICIAIAVLFYAPAGSVWWFWMFIPAFMGIGGGIAEYVRFKHSQQTPQLTPPTYAPPAIASAPHGGELPPRPAATGYQSGSVTEHTTQLLERDQ